MSYNWDTEACSACSNSTFGGNSRCVNCTDGFFFVSNGNNVPKRHACLICDNDSFDNCIKCDGRSRFFSTRASVNWTK
jgi:hypothetical protein